MALLVCGIDQTYRACDSPLTSTMRRTTSCCSPRAAQVADACFSFTGSATCVCLRCIRCGLQLVFKVLMCPLYVRLLRVAMLVTACARGDDTSGFSSIEDEYELVRLTVAANDTCNAKHWHRCSLHTAHALVQWRAGSGRVVYDSAWHVVTLSSPQPSRKVEQYCAQRGQASLLLCFVLTCYCCVTVIMADKTSTIRTRKFMNNQLLRRKQFVSDVSRSAYNSQDYQHGNIRLLIRSHTCWAGHRCAPPRKA